MTRIFRALLLWCALALTILGFVVPATAQDGAAAAAKATKAAAALKAYSDGVRKAGRRPDFTAAPAADLIRTVFDAERFAALPAPVSHEIEWLMEWADAANTGYKQVGLFGLSLAEPPDEMALARNLRDYEDQIAIALSFMVRIMAREVTTSNLFMAELPKEQRTPIREAGFQGMRSGFGQYLQMALCTAHGMKPGNVRMLLTAIHETQATWVETLSPADNAKVTLWLKEILNHSSDKDVTDGATMLVAAFGAKN